jgi:hypothetical protein
VRPSHNATLGTNANVANPGTAHGFSNRLGQPGRTGSRLQGRGLAFRPPRSASRGSSALAHVDDGVERQKEPLGLARQAVSAASEAVPTPVMKAGRVHRFGGLEGMTYRDDRAQAGKLEPCRGHLRARGGVHRRTDGVRPWAGGSDMRTRRQRRPRRLGCARLLSKRTMRMRRRWWMRWSERCWSSAAPVPGVGRSASLLKR